MQLHAIAPDNQWAPHIYTVFYIMIITLLYYIAYYTSYSLYYIVCITYFMDHY